MNWCAPKDVGVGCAGGWYCPRTQYALGNSLTVASTIQDHCAAFSATWPKGLTRSRLEEYVENTRMGAEILVRGLHHAAELVSSFKQVAVDQTSLNRREFDLAATMNEGAHDARAIHAQDPTPWNATSQRNPHG